MQRIPTGALMTLRPIASQAELAAAAAGAASSSVWPSRFTVKTWQGGMHRAGPGFARWPSILNETPIRYWKLTQNLGQPCEFHVCGPEVSCTGFMAQIRDLAQPFDCKLHVIPAAGINLCSSAGPHRPPEGVAAQIDSPGSQESVLGIVS